MMRIGLRPYQLRTVNDGLSSKAVRRPTMIASASALFFVHQHGRKWRGKYHRLAVSAFYVNEMIG